MSNAQQVPLTGQAEILHATESSSQPRNPTNISDLPNELLLNIFNHLDTPKPSSTDSLLYDEPIFDTTKSDIANLKAASCISKRWRAAITPLLFKHTRLIIPKSNAKDTKDFRADIQQFFEFVSRNGLRKVITSFVLVCYGNSFENDKERDPENVLSIFWEALFEVMDPVELMIVAPAEVLAFFTGCEVNDEESWNFDCPCQYLRLQRSPDSLPVDEKLIDETLPRGNKPTLVSDAQGLPSLSVSELQSARLPNAILFERQWSKILLNEGSFVKAYSTYEFWERSPPSILSSLLIGMINIGSGLSSPPLISPTIRDLEYIGIFPMESHFANITAHIPRLDRLYVQLVPRNDILNDSVKMKRVDAVDLWAERNRCYAILMRELFTAPAEGNYRFLRTFESGDSADKEAWNMAVEYVKRANVGWVVAGDGVFVREVPTAQAEEGEGSAFENSLVRWAWNGTKKLPVPSTPLYFGMVF